jgi:glycosyltransferase involved in cell wall biosynthesis
LEEPDLVHILDMDLTLVPFIEFSAKQEIPFLVHASTITPMEERVGEYLPKAKRMITSSEAVKKWLMERFSEAYFRNYEILPWPVDVEDHPIRPDMEIRDTYKTPPDAKLIIVPGPIEDHQGQQDVLKAFSLIRQDFPIAYMWMVGDPYSHEGSNLPQEAVDLEISEKIRFVGEPPNLNEVYAACDLFVYAPQNGHPDSGPIDGIAACVPQAMAAGLPVVVTEAGGAPDYVLGTQAGAVVPPQSPEALADMIRTYLSNDALLCDAGHAAFQRAQNGFSQSAVATRLHTLYQQILTD